jgi:hypothetical protein
MAANGDVEPKATRREELRHGLITSSTKRRTAELSGLQHRVADNCEFWQLEICYIQLRAMQWQQMMDG